MADDIDVFGRTALKTIRPIMADMAIIAWHPKGGVPNPTSVIPGTPDQKPPGILLSKATSINLTMQQSVTRRRTLGGYGNVAVIFPSQPQGQLTVGRLLAARSTEEGNQDLTQLPGWNSCDELGTLTITFSGASAYGGNCSVKGELAYKLTGVTVQSYSLQADAESLAVVDNLSLEFLQLFANIRN